MTDSELEWEAADTPLSPPAPTTQPILPPPLWLNRFAWWFRLGLGLFLLLSALLGLAGCGRGTAMSWQPATAVLPQAVLAEVITQNTSLEPTAVSQLESTLQAWQVPGKEGNLVVLHFNTPKLCGTLGCLYVGVWVRDQQSPAQVFATYLNPHLPPHESLFTVLETSEHPTASPALPCLNVTQMVPGVVSDDGNERLQQVTACFNGKQYRFIDGVLRGV